MLNNNNSIVRWWEKNYIPNQIGNNGITINNELIGRCKKFNCEQHSFDIKFDSVSKTFAQAKNEISKMFTDLHSKFLNLMGPKDSLRITFFHTEFDRPVGYPFMKKSVLETTNLQDNFENVIQSYREISMNANNSLKAVVIVAHLPSGSGGSKLKINNLVDQQDFFDYNVSTHTITNDDNWCAIRAVIIAIAIESGDKLRIKRLQKKNSALLAFETLMTANKCSIPNVACGIPEFKKLEIYFRDYQIMVIENCGKLTEPIFIGNKNDKYIYLSFTGTHYNVIKSIARFYRSSYYCHHCKKAYNNINGHHCDFLCKCCNRPKCIKNEKCTLKFKCKSCLKSCNNLLCKRQHEEKFCLAIRTCYICHRIKSLIHVCTDEKYCKNCRKVVPIDHKCYILQPEKNEKQNEASMNGYIFFDYEAYQCEHKLKHIANLIIAEKVCIECINQRPCNSDCTIHTFYTNDEFCKWLFTKTNEGFTAIAHNFQG
jgi:hypothetical protein